MSLLEQSACLPRLMGLVALAAALAGSPAHGQIVLGAGTPLTSFGSAERDLPSQQAYASEFHIGALDLSITAVDFLARVDFNAQSTRTLLVQLFTDVVDINTSFHHPGSLLASESVSINATQNLQGYTATFSTPVELSANQSYWLVLARPASDRQLWVETMFEDNEFYIQAGATPEAGMLQGTPPSWPTTFTDRTLLYNLHGSTTAVPEPGSMLLLGGAGMGLGMMWLRRRAPRVSAVKGANRR